MWGQSNQLTHEEAKGNDQACPVIFQSVWGLDDSARQIAAQDPSIKGAVDMLLHLKGSSGDPFGQMTALTELRRAVAPNVHEQNWLHGKTTIQTLVGFGYLWDGLILFHYTFIQPSRQKVSLWKW